MENKVMETLLERRSVRKYQAKEVPEELIEEVLKAGAYAPSGMGKQPVIAVVVTKKEVRDRLSRLNAAVMGADIDPFYGAPAVIVVLADRSSMTYLYDGSLAMGNMMNAAHALGLGSCWIHRAKEVMATDEGQALLKELGVEGDYEGIGNLILGYPEGELPQARPRKEEFAYWVK